MTPETVLAFGRLAMEMLLTVCAPILLTALAVGLAVSLFQAVTQINEPTLSFLPKLLAAITTVGFGGSAALEGPSIYGGGAIGSWLWTRLQRVRWLTLNARDRRIMLICGAAAGMSSCRWWIPASAYRPRSSRWYSANSQGWRKARGRPKAWGSASR